MATKTFKIGLSNTDKQNMAQDVYERLLALTFPEYDTRTQYSVGDFVVYNDQLYKCIGATTGAWDSSKWQLATFNDLVSDIEDAVQFVNDKANVDGNYPTMTVGVADNLSPYDEESGIKQHAPFNFQASGTNNGSDPTATVGALAIMSEKRGNTVVVNQYAKEVNTTNWTIESGTGNIADGIATFTAISQYGGISCSFAKEIITGHKYFFMLAIKPTTDLTSNQITFIANNGADEIGTYGKTANAGVWNYWYAIDDTNLASTRNYTVFRVYDNRASGWDAIQVKEPLCIDLTQLFGSNDAIPQDLLDNPDNFFRYYQGSLAYNEGTLVNANSRYLKAIGRNQWDEELEEGVYSYSDGSKVAGPSGYMRSKNFIKVIPNATYYRGLHYWADGHILFYDKDKNFISITASGSVGTFTTPANCCYITFYVNYGGTTYNNDITISLYYEGESGYDQYYPYEELTNNDTGNETLRSAGSVADIKLPDGTIKRNVGVVDLGSLTWDYYSGLFFSNDLNSLIKRPSTNGQIMYNWIIANGKYEPTYVWHIPIEGTEKLFAVSDAGTLYFQDGDYGTDATAFKNAMSGVYLFYELETPTTEQGTPYSENVVIDDFGTMDFSGTSGVPQGNALFYPVDYKAYLDTLHKYTDGDPSNLVLKEEITDSALNTRGYFKVEDLSGTVRIIDENQGLWTTDYKKLIKIGDLYTLNLCVTNATGQTLLTSDIAEIPSANVSQKILFSNCELTSYRRVKMLSGSSIETNGKLYVNISWVNK